MRDFGLPAWYGDFGEMSLGGETVSPAWLRVGSFASGLVRDTLLYEGGMVLGADFIITHRVLFSFSQHKVYFTAAGDRPYLGKEM